MDSAQLLAAATASSCSVFGNAHVEENAVVGSGLVSLRRGEVRGPEGQKLRPGHWQEAAEAVVEGEARGDVPAPGQDSLATQAEWTGPVEWVGTVRERNVAGADVGNRLYAGKKRMFKGHKWERVRERRVARTNMLLRDMDKRIQRFKGVRYYFSSSLLPPPPLSPFFYSFCSSFANPAFPFSFCAFQYRAKGRPLPLARRNNVLKKTQKLPF